MTEIKGDLGSGISFVQLGNTGPLVILLEGIRVDHKPLSGPALIGFRDTFKEWASDFTIVHVSRPHGLEEGTTLAGMASQIANGLKGKYSTDFHLVGTGVGGALALHMAAENPESVKSVVLHSSGPKLSSLGQSLYQELLDLSSLEKWGSVHNRLAKIMFNSSLGKFLGGLTASMFSEDLGTPDSPWDFQVTLLAELAQDCHSLAPFVQCPVLSFLGGKDPVYDTNLARTFIESLNSGIIEVFPKVAHGIAKLENLSIWKKTFEAIHACGDN